MAPARSVPMAEPTVISRVRASVGAAEIIPYQTAATMIAAARNASTASRPGEFCERCDWVLSDTRADIEQVLVGGWRQADLGPHRAPDPLHGRTIGAGNSLCDGQWG